jgi:hypothetical protein
LLISDRRFLSSRSVKITKHLVLISNTVNIRFTINIFAKCFACSSVVDRDPEDSYVFGPPGSASGSVSQSPDPDPYQNTTVPLHWLVDCRIQSLIRNTLLTGYVLRN